VKATFRVLVMVLAGAVGGYFGYWLGYLAGWSTDAEWPFSIGRGAGAIATSIVLAAAAVLGTGAVLRRYSRR
jgi:hypothetical protein